MSTPKQAQPLSNEARKLVLKAMSAAMQDVLYKSRLGREYGAERNIYDALGYNISPCYTEFLALYRRQGVARKVVNAPVHASWREFPKVEEPTDKDTAFEKAFKKLAKELKLQNRFPRVDKLASLGTYAVLLIGFKDLADWSTEITTAKGVAYVQPYSEATAKVATWETDKANERFGLPLTYGIEIGQGTGKKQQTVHWSRVLHVTVDALESDVDGTPRLEAVYNDLKNLEKISGGSAEMFWRGAFPGYVFKLLDAAGLSDEDEAKMTEEIKKYLHDLQRIIRTSNVDVQSLTPQVADPSAHIDKQIDLIAAGADMPKRILLGSERGELASSQDDENWQVRIDERRKQHCEPNILRAFIDRMVKLGVLPKPTAGADAYDVTWPDLMSPSEKDKADIGLIRANTIRAYADSMGAQETVPLETFLSKYMNLTDEEIQVIQEQLDALQKDANGNPADPLDQSINPGAVSPVPQPATQPPNGQVPPPPPQPPAPGDASV